MRLSDLALFAPVREQLREAALKLRTAGDAVTLLAPLDPTGVIGLALIEGACLDAGIPYTRRFLPRPAPAARPLIRLSSDPTEAGWDAEQLHLTLAPVQVEALVGSGGDTRLGSLHPVAQASALAQLIAADGKKTRMLRPWALAGNWLSDGMAHTYDPVYTVLRDALAAAAVIRVVPLPEVDAPFAPLLPKVEPIALEAIRDRWSHLDLEGRAQALSHLSKAQLLEDTPSTARLEELVWHRVLGLGWDVDLASQLEALHLLWRDDVDSRQRNLGDALDRLLREGRC